VLQVTNRLNNTNTHLTILEYYSIQPSVIRIRCTAIESMPPSNSCAGLTCDLAIAFAKLEAALIDTSKMPNDQTNSQRRFTVIELPVPQ
jgi:hypothetical protein